MTVGNWFTSTGIPNGRFSCIDVWVARPPQDEGHDVITVTFDVVGVHWG